MRKLGREVGGQSLWWSSLGRNKQFVSIDLNRPRGKPWF